MGRTLLWLDLETTGLAPRKDAILEIAIARADFDRPFELTPLYHAVISSNPQPEYLSSLRRIAVRSDRYSDPYDWEYHAVAPEVWEMHKASGLLDAGRASSVTLANVDHDLQGLIPFAAEMPDRPIIAGANPQFDRSFLEIHLPDIWKRLHYRVYDTDAIMLFCESLGMPKYQKRHAHRAQADILDEVENAKACLAWLAWLRDFHFVQDCTEGLPIKQPAPEVEHQPIPRDIHEHMTCGMCQSAPGFCPKHDPTL